MNPLLDMGRDLTESARGWHFRETVSGYSRISKYFRTKEEALDMLREGGYPEQLIAMLDETGHVPSIILGGPVTSPGLEIDRILRVSNKLTDAVSIRIGMEAATLMTESVFEEDGSLDLEKQTDEVRESVLYVRSIFAARRLVAQEEE